MPVVDISVGQIETGLGPMFVALTDAGVAALSRRSDLDGFVAPLGRRFPGGEIRPRTALSGSGDGRGDALAGAIERYLAGEASAISAVADLRGLPRFDAAVYRVVMAIPYGETATYGEVAARVGSARAARAVGNAMARCPLFPVVPCHRVVSATGLGGWGPDPSVKRRLLAMERGVGATTTRRCRPQRYQ